MIRYFSLYFSYLIFVIIVYALSRSSVPAPHAIQIIGLPFLLCTGFFIALLINERFFGKGLPGFIGATLCLAFFDLFLPVGQDYAFYIGDQLVRSGDGLTPYGKMLFYRDLIIYSIVNAAGVMLGYFLVRRKHRLCERFRLTGGG